MGNDATIRPIQNSLEGVASRILQEVIQADMSMHHDQMLAWQWFSQHLPKGELINHDLGEGIPRSLYLALSEVNLKFAVRPLTLSFRRRIQLAWRMLIGKARPLPALALNLELCSPSDPTAMNMEVRITRFKNGTVKATYGPADEITEHLLKQTGA